VIAVDVRFAGAPVRQLHPVLVTIRYSTSAVTGSSRCRGASSTSSRRGARFGRFRGPPRTIAPPGSCRSGCCSSRSSPSRTIGGRRA
jgi:hypothetical protein